MSLLVTFVLCGFWHRATWTFLLFGFLHGAAMVTELKFAIAPPAADRALARALHAISAHAYTLAFVACTLVLFSAIDLSHAGSVFYRTFTSAPFPSPTEFFAYKGPVLFLLMLARIAIWQILERWHRRMTSASSPYFVAIAAMALLFLGQPDGVGFVYAQF